MGDYECKNSISIDWISFTVLKDSDVHHVSDDFLDDDFDAALMGFTCGFGAVIHAFGISHNDLFRIPSGRNGYDCVFKICDSSAFVMYHSSRDDMGIHFDIPSSSIDFMFKQWSDCQEVQLPYSIFDFLLFIDRIGSISRLDIAYDDFEFQGVKPGYYPADLWKLYLEDRIVSKFRSFQFLAPYLNNNPVGATFYAGRRSSELLLRVYDKKLEQNEKRKKACLDPLTDDWVRWELEIHKRHVDAFMSELRAVSSCFGYFDTADFRILNMHFFSVINGLMRVIDLTDSNRSRCPVNENWKRWLSALAVASVSVSVSPSTLARKLSWFDRQVLPALLSLFVGHDLSWKWVYHRIYKNLPRIRPNIRDKLNEIVPDYENILLEKYYFTLNGDYKPLFDLTL